jgi:hypothetical protein
MKRLAAAAILWSTVAGSRAHAAPATTHDPVFVSVDRDQLQALCLAARLPATHEVPSYAALVLHDGTRVPWLTFTVDAKVEAAESRPALTPAAWRKAAVAVFEPPVTDDPPSERRALDVQYRVCDGNERDVVVSAVFVERDGYHVIVTRGEKQVEKVLPAKTPNDKVYATGFDLIESMLGQRVTIAVHQVAAGPGQPTTDDERWLRAAH